MGCDIHFYVEALNEHFGEVPGTTCWISQDTWKEQEDWPGTLEVPYDEKFYRGRHYPFFGRLCGVCGDGGAIPIRGMPEDCSALIKQVYEHWGADGHSHTWATLAELETVKVDDLIMSLEWHDCLMGMREIIRKHEFLPNKPEHVRAVFWFDN